MKLYFTVLLLFLGSFTFSQNPEKPAFSRMDVFGLQWANDPQISPDGTQIVYERKSMDIMRDRRTARLWLMNADGSNAVKLSGNDVSESSARWSPDGTKIAYISSTDEQGAEIFLYWTASGKTARLTQLERSPRELSWSPDGKQLAFSMLVPEVGPVLVKPPKKPKGAEWADNPRITTRVKHEADGSGYMEPGHYQVFVVAATGGKPRQITTGPYQHRTTPVWTPDGATLLLSANRNNDWEYDYRNSEIYAVNVQTGKIEPLTDRQGPDYNPVVSPDGRQIAYLGYEDQVQTYQVAEVTVMKPDGSGKKTVNINLDRNISNLTWDARGQGLYFQYDDHGNTKIGYTSLSGKMKVIAENVGGTNPARPYGGGSFSVSGNDKLAYTHTTPYHPADVAVVTDGDTERVTDLNTNLLNYRTLGEVEEITYTSSVDNREIQGWVVKPPFFKEDRQYPLLVENHGGPIANYGDRFSPEMQLYASAGFVVFYPNPRGSTGYGEEFGNLLYHDYPGDDYHDVMDGVDAMLERNYITEDSLFVTGGSAGGIMTAWMIGKNNRFRAAAVIKPVMNWVSKTLVADNYYGYANYRYPGQPWENIETYMKFSPVSLVGNIETPTLVMVGTADLRTPLSESKQLYHALKLRKIETALVEMPGAYHFIANRPSQLISKIDHIVAWFNRYRGGSTANR